MQQQSAKRRSSAATFYEVHLAAVFLDAVFLSVRPDGPKEGVLVAWGFTEEGERVLLAVMLGMRESRRDEPELPRAAQPGSFANVWTVRDEMIGRVDFYLEPPEALKAVGLSECPLTPGQPLQPFVELDLE